MGYDNQKGFSAIAIIAILVAIVAAGLIAWRLLEANRTPNGLSSTNTTEQEQVADPNEGYVVIKEWGVRFKPVDGLAGVQYFKPAHLTSDHLTFTTTALSDLSQSCSEASGEIVLGLLTRSLEQNEQHGGLLAKVGDYYYQYRGPQAACSEDYEAESEVISSLRESLKTLEAAK